jgi:hypothetical protein
MLPRAATAPRCAASFEHRRHRSQCRIPVSFRKFGLASLGRLAAERLYSTVCRRAARARPARLSQLVKSGRHDSGFLDREQSSDETKFWFNRLLSREERVLERGTLHVAQLVEIFPVVASARLIGHAQLNKPGLRVPQRFGCIPGVYGVAVCTIVEWQFRSLGPVQ